MRDRILEISQEDDFFSMAIVPKDVYKKNKLLMKWFKSNKVKNRLHNRYLKERSKFKLTFKKSFEDEKTSINIISEYPPTSNYIFRKPPDYEHVEKILVKIEDFENKPKSG